MDNLKGNLTHFSTNPTVKGFITLTKNQLAVELMGRLPKKTYENFTFSDWMTVLEKSEWDEEEEHSRGYGKPEKNRVLEEIIFANMCPLAKTFNDRYFLYHRSPDEKIKKTIFERMVESANNFKDRLELYYLVNARRGEDELKIHILGKISSFEEGFEELQLLYTNTDDKRGDDKKVLLDIIAGYNRGFEDREKVYEKFPHDSQLRDLALRKMTESLEE